MAIASVEGLGSLTIGRLARELGISTSRVFAHFRSKETVVTADGVSDEPLALEFWPPRPRREDRCGSSLLGAGRRTVALVLSRC